MYLHGERVDLRPIEEDDIATIHRWRRAVGENPFTTLPAMSLGDARRRYLEREQRPDEGGALLAVTKEGTPVGLLSYHRVGYGIYSPAYNIGIEIAPEARRKGYGAETQRLLADYLLALFPIGRVEASTESENIAEQRALEKAGFQREGVARRAAWREGEWHDMVLYGRTRDDQ